MLRTTATANTLLFPFILIKYQTEGHLIVRTSRPLKSINIRLQHEDLHHWRCFSLWYQCVVNNKIANVTLSSSEGDKGKCWQLRSSRVCLFVYLPQPTAVIYYMFVLGSCVTQCSRSLLQYPSSPLLPPPLIILAIILNTIVDGLCVAFVRSRN